MFSPLYTTICFSPSLCLFLSLSVSCSFSSFLQYISFFLSYPWQCSSFSVSFNLALPLCACLCRVIRLFTPTSLFLSFSPSLLLPLSPSLPYSLSPSSSVCVFVFLYLFPILSSFVPIIYLFPSLPCTQSIPLSLSVFSRPHYPRLVNV